MLSRARLTLLGIFAVGLLVLLAGVLKVMPRATGAVARPTAITVSFKLDPRVVDPTHGGTPWVAKDAYFGANAQDTVEARAQGIDPKGKPLPISPDWIASDPDMVKVSPSRGEQVRIVVKRAGKSKLKIVAGGVSTERVVQAKYLGKFIQIAITRPPAGEPAQSAEATVASKPSPGTGAVASTPFPGTAEIAARKARILAENKKKEGKLTLPNGFQYRVLQTGDGRRPNHGDVVEAHYRITLMDGTELANSYASGKPARITVARATSGLKEALELMRVGSKWQLFLPRELGRGGGRRSTHKHQGMAIPARVLEVELLAIEAPESAGQRMATDIAPPGGTRK